MANNFDRSHKDKKYFINGSTYNCPFCNRGSMNYFIEETTSYDSSNTNKTYIYLIRCGDDDCSKISLHLSKYYLMARDNKFCMPIKHITDPDRYSLDAMFRNFNSGIVKDILDKEGNIITELDDAFFYHSPSESFTIDQRIPNKIKEPLAEAQQCLKNNFLTGASGCLRKAIYKMLQDQKIPERDEGQNLLKYEERIEHLKKQTPRVDEDLINYLKAIHILTSTELHENDWEDYDAPNLRFLIEITKDVLYEIYVLPDEKNKRREQISELKIKATAKK
jgi:hypothetical protein